VWVVHPASETVETYRELLSPRRLSGTDRLEAEDVLPGFSVTVGALFEI